jgi:hypothetical protein
MIYFKILIISSTPFKLKHSTICTTPMTMFSSGHRQVLESEFVQKLLSLDCLKQILMEGKLVLYK